MTLIPRCQCYGQCGRLTGRKRVCAQPDLEGRCRAEHGSIHPLNDRVTVITKVQALPDVWVDLCQDCKAALDTRPPPPRQDNYPLFT